MEKVEIINELSEFLKYLVIPQDLEYLKYY